MLKIKLQFFGGRGGGGGKGSGGGGAAGEAARASAIQNNQSFPAGNYEYEGDTYKIGYTKPNRTNEIYQTVDGHVTGNSHVQVMVEGQDSGKYRAYNESGSVKVTGSAKVASKWAFGTPKDQGFKRKKSR